MDSTAGWGLLIGWGAMIIFYFILDVIDHLRHKRALQMPSQYSQCGPRSEEDKKEHRGFWTFWGLIGFFALVTFALSEAIVKEKQAQKVEVKQ